MDLDIFLAVWDRCSFQFRLESRITPKNLVEGNKSSLDPPIRMSIESILCLDFIPKIIRWVFPIFNESRLARSQSTRRGISRLMVEIISDRIGPEVKRLVSSANIIEVSLSEMEPRSLMYIRNKMGPKIEPWGTPHVILDIVELEPL